MPSAAEPVWEQLQSAQEVPHYPNVTVGWDSSPCTVQSETYDNRGYTWMAVLHDNTPEIFGDALKRAVEYERSSGHSTKLVTINAWDGWTEGSYLLPDTVHGLGYFEACADAKDSARKN